MVTKGSARCTSSWSFRELIAIVTKSARLMSATAFKPTLSILSLPVKSEKLRTKAATIIEPM